MEEYAQAWIPGTVLLPDVDENEAVQDRKAEA